MKFNSLQNRLRFNPIVFKCDFLGLGGLYSAIGGVTSSTISSLANVAIAQATNNANRDIAQQTNEANVASVNNTNAANIQMNEENNALQIQLQKEMNEYNSLASQLERAQAAGVNPNAVVSRMGGNVQTTLPSTQAGHADAPLRQIGAPMQSARVENPMTGVLDAVRTYIDSKKTSEDAKLVGLQADNQKVANEFQRTMLEQGIKLTDAQSQYFVNSANLAYAQVDNVKATVNQINKAIESLDQTVLSQKIDNYYKSDMYEEQLNYLEKQCNYTDAQAKYCMAILPSAIGLNKALAFNATQQGNLAIAQKALTEKERERVDKDIQFMTLQSGREALNFLIESDEDVIKAEKQNRKLQPKLNQENIKNLEYINSRTNRVIQGFRDVTIGIGSGIVAGAQAKKAFGNKPLPSTSNGSKNFINPADVPSTPFN